MIVDYCLTDVDRTLEHIKKHQERVIAAATDAKDPAVLIEEDKMTRVR